MQTQPRDEAITMSIKSLRHRPCRSACGAAALLVGGCSDAKPAASPAGTRERQTPREQSRPTSRSSARPGTSIACRAPAWVTAAQRSTAQPDRRPRHGEDRGTDSPVHPAERPDHRTGHPLHQHRDAGRATCSTSRPRSDRGPMPLVTGPRRGNRLETSKCRLARQARALVHCLVGRSMAGYTPSKRRCAASDEARREANVLRRPRRQSSGRDGNDGARLRTGPTPGRLLRVAAHRHRRCAPTARKSRGARGPTARATSLKTRIALMNIEILRIHQGPWPWPRATRPCSTSGRALPSRSIDRCPRPTRPGGSATECTSRTATRPTCSVRAVTAGEAGRRPHGRRYGVGVRARPRPATLDAPDDPPTDADRQPNNFIQSDDPKIVADAREGGRQGDRSVARGRGLERYVHDAVTLKDFTQAFATAAEVARDPRGRLHGACGVPGRAGPGPRHSRPRGRGAGLPAEPTRHSATTCGPRCTSTTLDPARRHAGPRRHRRGPPQVAHSNMQGASAYSSFLPVVQLMRAD